MVLCLLSRDSHGDTTKLNHEETVRGPEIAISPEKSEILLLRSRIFGQDPTKVPRYRSRSPLRFIVCPARKISPSTRLRGGNYEEKLSLADSY